MKMKKLGWCTPFSSVIKKKITLDLDQPQEQQKMRTYNGLESFILNSWNYDDESATSRADGCTTDSLDEDDSCSSSSKEVSGSFTSQCLVQKHEHNGLDEWEEVSKCAQDIDGEERKSISIQSSDVETMKEKFSKLLLGEDVTGGCKGLTTALALSNAITNLAASVFGELWKLEPLSKERKCRWRREMGWFLSPANYMVELVPTKQNGTNGRSLEIMTTKVRADISVNLPALQKLDSMLIETLDLMVNTEFWYVERGSRAEGRTKTERLSKRWWLPSPQVPLAGLSPTGRKKLLYYGKVVDQILMAAKMINKSILLEMPVPTFIKDALPKCGRGNLGEELYRVLSAELNSPEAMVASLNLENEHIILQIMNQLESCMLSWKQKISDQVGDKSPLRTSWSLTRDSISEVEKTVLMLERAEALLQVLRIRFPNTPQTFLEANKIRYNKDVGHSIIEAYSRVIGNLAFSILSRIRDVLLEDDLISSNTPRLMCCSSNHNRYSLIGQMNEEDGKH